jgi:aminobenzoyl-glutamate utilization protein A
LLALPDKRLVVECEPLVLVRGELGAVGARVDERLAGVVAGVVRDDIAHLDTRLVHLGFAAAVELRVDDQPIEGNLAGLEQFPGSAAQVGIQHVRFHTRTFGATGLTAHGLGERGRVRAVKFRRPVSGGMDATEYGDWLRSTRRALHRRPEPAWREFYTTARIVEELRGLDVDDIEVGPEILADGERGSVPDEEQLAAWLDQARGYDVDDAVLDRLAGGYTGAIATLHRGEGPTVALRVDIDGLPRTESDDDEHVPAAEGFRSNHDGHMHACGHDAHATIGLGVLRAVADSDFQGTLKVLFQPAEEVIGGGRPVAKSGHLDDVDALLAVHVGLDHPTGDVVAGIDDFLAVAHFRAEFHGEGAHAGGNPNRGRNAVQAMATAVGNLYGIARHEDGATRVNAGDVGGGTAPNIIPEEAYIHAEVRGGTTELMNYTRERAYTVVENAAQMHDCTSTVEPGPEAPSAESDEQLVDLVADVAGESGRVERAKRRDSLGGSEDATFLMDRVQDQGGLATYVGVGTDHPGGHHTATFDVDEESLLVGVEVLAESIRRLGGDGSSPAP